MKETTSQKLISYIIERENVTAKEMGEFLDITRQALFKHLAKLIESGEIVKVGRPPKVFYSINKEKKGLAVNFDSKVLDIIKENYLIITASGEMKEGADGFTYWCRRNNLDPIKTSLEYTETLKKYNKYKMKSGLIDGMVKMKSTFSEVYLDKLFYIDFYSIERFGKTKLGQLLLYAKQSQNKPMIKILSGLIKERVEKIISGCKVDGIAFIPPTVKREVQLMKEIENNLNLPYRKLTLAKVKTDVVVPQKTLNKLEDRIENAARSIFVQDRNTYNNILIIDDAVGSGATLNEVAKKIRNSGICKGKIIGLAITGSFKGFDVISEV
jgi:dimeric dUTPase (all-alpha-NTP-PPase superfamily)